MPIPLLARLCRRELPVELTRPSDVEVARVLHLAGHIICDLPAPSKGLGGEMRGSVLVTSVTATGREMALSFGGEPRKPTRRSSGPIGPRADIAVRPDRGSWRLRLRELWMRLRR